MHSNTSAGYANFLMGTDAILGTWLTGVGFKLGRSWTENSLGVITNSQNLVLYYH